MYRNFEELITKVKTNHVKRVLAVASAADDAVIDAVITAEAAGLISPVLIGNAGKIAELLRKRDKNVSAYNIVNTADDNTAKYAVELIRDGSAHVLMKGLMETREFLGPIVKKENGLQTSSIMSHIAFFEIPNYHKLLMISDSGMVMYPSLLDKKHIIENATHALRNMGYSLPKHAVVCAIETVNPKMPETVEADDLMKMNISGEISDCIVEGPISYDVAMSSRIAFHKGFASQNVGDYDCMIMPNMQAGNILGKSLTVTAGAKMAGIIVGIKAPAIMTSRGSDAIEKFYSIAMAALAADC